MTIKELELVCRELKLTPLQVISQYYTSLMEDNPFTLPRSEYNDLCARGFTQKGHATEKYQVIVKNLIATIKEKESSKPVIDNMQVDDKVQAIIEYLYKTVMAKVPDPKKIEDVKDYFDGNDLLTSLYFTWLYLFPDNNSTPENNAGWKNLFGIDYNGVRLRLDTEGARKNFKKMVNKKDIGIFIFATYRFIKDHIRDGRHFIPKISNYYPVQEDWYDSTRELVEKSDQATLWGMMYHQTANIVTSNELDLHLV